jgi:cytochrome c
MTMKSRFTFILLLVVMVVSACAGEVIGVPEERMVNDGSIEHGRQLMASYGCGSCHFIPGVAGADAMAAPPLNNFYQRTYIAGRLPNTLDNLILWIEEPQAVEPGTAMPDLGIKAAEARDMAAYLYHQLTITDLIRQ